MATNLLYRFARGRFLPNALRAVLAFCAGILPFWLAGQCLEGDCRHGEGIYQYADGMRYAGQFSGGQPHGEGMLLMPGGERFQGRFANGQPNGQGWYLYANGNRVKGVWQGGALQQVATREAMPGNTIVAQTGCLQGDCQNGRGTWAFADGSVYNGFFQQGRPEGWGVCSYPDGSHYEGHWQGGHPDGQGFKRWPNGRQFTGLWREGHPLAAKGWWHDPGSTAAPIDPHGVRIPQASCISGNCANGRGVYGYPDGSRYEGDFVNSRPHGQGTFYYPNGDAHRGSFQNGLPHGQGERLYADGRTVRGQWIEGGLVDNQSLASASHCLSGDCQGGFGTYRFQDGSRYTGQFAAGLPHGNGTVMYPNGDRYEGRLEDGAFSGFGTYYKNDGSLFEGYWQGGNYLGNRRQMAVAPGGTPAASNQPSIKIWALIVGVAAYQYMPALRFPDDDAYRLFAFLQSPQGGAVPDERIRILIDEDATKANIVSGMQDIFMKAGPQDVVLLYFSGHGLPGAFLPIDYEGSTSRLLGHAEIRQWLERSPAAYKLCLADACHSGGLLTARGPDRRLPELLNTYYENLAGSKPGTALIMSSKAEETSLESSGLRQGVFSHFLLRGMKGEADTNADGIVRLQELFNYVEQQVRAYTQLRQSPVLQGNYDANMPISVVR